LDTQAEAKFQTLLESAPDAIVIADGAGQIVIANHQAELLFGYTHAELIGAQIELLLPESLRGAHVGHRARYAAAPRTRPMGTRHNLTARRKDGGEFPVEISLSPLRTEDGMLVTSVIRDASERVRSAEELERQVRRRTAHLNTLLQFSQELLPARSLDAVLRRALDHALALAPEAQCGAIYLYDPAGDTLALRASAGFSKLPAPSLPTTLGAIGKAFTTRRVQVASSRDEYFALVPDLTDERRRQILGLMNLEELPTGVLALPLVAHGQAIGALLLLRKTGEGPFVAEACATLEGLANLTAAAILEERSARAAASLSTQLASLEEQQRALTERLKSADAAILQAARLAAVGQLSAAIAHEINNPLYAARNCLYLLEDEPPERVRDSGYLAIAREQLARIAGIIQRMRDFYRPARGDLAPADVNDLLQDTLALAGLNTRNAQIKIIFTPDHALPSVLCNADQLRQVFLNLVLNAIEAMPNGGVLTVRTVAGPTVALIEIQDSGAGIPEDIRTHLFEPFFTNKPNGTGLGLTISAHIVTQHGGRIEVESAEGQGSTFSVVLPYQPSI
jgi:two-component system NtrC family sensor kinase